MPVPAIVSWLDENWQTVECQFYGGIQAGAFQAAIGSAFTGKIPLALGLAGVSYAAGWTAEQAGCNYRPPEAEGPQVLAGCKKVSGTGGSCNGILYANRTDFDPPGFKYNVEVKEITRIETFLSELGDGEVIYEVWGIVGTCDVTLEEKVIVTLGESLLREPYFTLVPKNGATCEEPVPDIQPPTHNPGDPIADPINHVISSCNWTIQATDAYVDDQLRMHTYYTITARDETCGGPFAYWSSDEGPQWVAPEPPYNPDDPDEPGPPLPPPDYNPRFDDIEEKLDQLKECACPETPVIEGEYRTISFRSDETSPYGKSRLRKRFKYRSQSGLDLGAVVDHWRDFTWQAGPITVSHFGSALGAPQVWAASIDEGKRVIRHAGGEAGIDPDQVGKWGIGGSDNARYGVSDTMRVDTTGGYYWITARDGSNGRPIVARV